jgi:hypothetical protein
LPGLRQRGERRGGSRQHNGIPEEAHTERRS